MMFTPTSTRQSRRSVSRSLIGSAATHSNPCRCGVSLAAPRGGLSSGPAAPAHILNTLVAFLETPALWRRDYDIETARGLLSGGGAQGSPLLSASTLLGFVARVNIEAYIKSPVRTHALVTAAPPPSWMPAGRGYRVVEWC